MWDRRAHRRLETEVTTVANRFLMRWPSTPSYIIAIDCQAIAPRAGSTNQSLITARLILQVVNRLIECELHRKIKPGFTQVLTIHNIMLQQNSQLKLMLTFRLS